MASFDARFARLKQLDLLADNSTRRAARTERGGGRRLIPSLYGGAFKLLRGALFLTALAGLFVKIDTYLSASSQTSCLRLGFTCAKESAIG